MGFKRRYSPRQLFFYMRHQSSVWRVFLLAVVVLAASLLYMDLRLRPQLREWGQVRARSLATQAINQAVRQEFAENGEEYRDLVSFEKDRSGKILAVKTDVVKANLLKSRIVDQISRKLQSAVAAPLPVPFGDVLGMDLPYGWGPELPGCRILPGGVHADLISVFTHARMNQTRHQVIVQAEVRIGVLVPGSESTLAVNSRISVSELVLIGHVPESYIYLGRHEENLLQDYLFFEK